MRRAIALAASGIIVWALVGPAARAALEPCDPTATPDLVVTGTFSDPLEGAHVMVPFVVPAGMTRVIVRLCHSQVQGPLAAQLRHVLDLGLYDARGGDGTFGPDGFRGWGGSSRPDVLITPEANTTVGYTPGPIPPGEWAAEIGLAAIAGLADGHPAATVEWRLEMSWASFPEDLDEPWKPVAPDTSARRAGPDWYAGDLHVHGRNSSPNDALMDEVFDYAFDETGAGLDFVALTDYVGVRSWSEIRPFQDEHPDHLILPGAEVITYRGHINNHGSLTYVDHRTGPVYEYEGGALTLVRESQPASRILSDIRAAGGYTQVNHPTIFPSKVPAFATLCRGCSWEYTDAETDWSRVDLFEVHTGPAGTPEPRGDELGPNPFTPLAVEWWDRLYRAGHRLTAVGVSDSHNAGRTPAGITQSPVGEATTVVYAEELSARAIRDGLLAGHAYVKLFGNYGPDLRFEARAPDGATAIMGDELTAESATLTAQVLNVPDAAQPRTLALVRDGVPIQAVHVSTFLPVVPEVTFQALSPGSYRLQLMRGSAIEALTNPITLTG